MEGRLAFSRCGINNLIKYSIANKSSAISKPRKKDFPYLKGFLFIPTRYCCCGIHLLLENLEYFQEVPSWMEIILTGTEKFWWDSNSEISLASRIVKNLEDKQSHWSTISLLVTQSRFFILEMYMNFCLLDKFLHRYGGRFTKYSSFLCREVKQHFLQKFEKKSIANKISHFFFYTRHIEYDSSNKTKKTYVLSLFSSF